MPGQLYKYHALGNDYIVIDPAKTEIQLTEATIRLICHRNFGVGSDGILYGPIFDGDHIRLRIYNPDGSEAEKSGNGIRIFAKYLVDAGYIKSSPFFLITLGGKVQVELLDEYAHNIKVDMGTATFQSNEIPVNGPAREVVNEVLEINGQSLQITCLSVGNPHCVIPVSSVSKELAVKIGPSIENHPLFPNRTNVQFMEVLDRNTIRIEIWERGAGYTLASGSSSCAAACAAYKLGLIDAQVNVQMPGGIIKVEIHDDGHVFMTGPVVAVMIAEFAGDLWEKLCYNEV